MSHYFSLTERKKTLFYLTSHRFFVVRCLYCVKKLLSENKMHRYHAYLCVLRSFCLVSSHNALYSQFESERVAGRGQITVVKQTNLTGVPLTEKKLTLFVYS